MATRTWDAGAGTGDPTTAGNWSADTAPVDTDTAIVASTSQSIITADQSSIELAALRILPGYGGTASGTSIGGTGSTWKIDATELEINNERCSFIRLEGIYPTVHARKIGGCQLYFGPTSDIGDFYAGDSGFVEFEAQAKLSTFMSDGMSARILGDTSSPDDLALYIPRGCVVECSRRIAFADVAGTLILTGAAEGDISAGTSEIIVQSGGKLDVRCTGNIDKIRAVAGAVVDGSKQPGGAAKVTVSSLIRSSRANVLLPTGLFSVSATIPIGDEGNIGQG